MKIAIIGHGFVGKATDYGFKCDKEIIDPSLYGNDTSDLHREHLDAAFVCVPTPMGDDGSINDSIVKSVVEELATHASKPVIIIKSTIHPGVLKSLSTITDRLVYNPEFLTERNANHDFINSPMVVIGGSSKSADFVKTLYEKHSIVNECPYYITDLYTASMVKYTMNCFLAVKVGFFNQIHDVFKEAGCETDWDLFTSIVSTDERIGKSHMNIPGPDGRKGWGGACFTKDTSAMTNYSDKMTILETAIKENNIIRSQYKQLDDRELEQNVKYNL